MGTSVVAGNRSGADALEDRPAGAPAHGWPRAPCPVGATGGGSPGCVARQGLALLQHPDCLLLAESVGWSSLGVAGGTNDCARCRTRALCRAHVMARAYEKGEKNGYGPESQRKETD